jgi:hypothetical protein
MTNNADFNINIITMKHRLLKHMENILGNINSSFEQYTLRLTNIALECTDISFINDTVKINIDKSLEELFNKISIVLEATIEHPSGLGSRVIKQVTEEKKYTTKYFYKLGNTLVEATLITLDNISVDKVLHTFELGNKTFDISTASDFTSQFTDMLHGSMPDEPPTFEDFINAINVEIRKINDIREKINIIIKDVNRNKKILRKNVTEFELFDQQLLDQ